MMLKLNGQVQTVFANLKPLIFLSVILGLIPSYGCLIAKTQKNQKLSRIHRFLIATIIFSVWIYIMIFITFYLTNAVDIILIFVLQTCKSCLICYSVTRTTINWMYLLETMVTIDAAFHNVDDLISFQSKRYYSKWQIFVYNFAFCIALLIHLILRYLSPHKFTIGYLVCLYILDYMIFVIVLLISYFSIWIKNKLKIVNDYLLNSLGKRTYVIISGERQFINFNTPNHISILENFHDCYKLLKIYINFYNKIFGIQILLLFGNILMLVLLIINYFIIESKNDLTITIFLKQFVAAFIVLVCICFQK